MKTSLPVFSLLLISVLMGCKNKFPTVNGVQNLTTASGCLLTKEFHDGWLDWSPSGEFLFFASSASDNLNLWRINMEEVELAVSPEGVMVASHILEGNFSKIAEQVTFLTEKDAICPVLSPNGEQMLFITYSCSDSGCADFDLRIMDFSTGESRILLTENVDYFDFLGQDRFVFVTKDNDSTLQEYELKTGEVREFLAFDQPLLAMQFTSGQLLVRTGNGVEAIDLET